VFATSLRVRFRSPTCEGDSQLAARMIFGRRSTQTKSLIFSVTAFNRGDQRTARGSSSSISVPQSRTKQRRRFATRFGAGSCLTAATRRLKICRGFSIRLSEADSSITGDIIALRSCLLTGRWGCGVAPRWVLYELKGSCTVLRDPRGESPRGYPRHLGIPRPIRSHCLRCGQFCTDRF
jgi:hypothetical protein